MYTAAEGLHTDANAAVAQALAAMESGGALVGLTLFQMRPPVDLNTTCRADVKNMGNREVV